MSEEQTKLRRVVENNEGILISRNNASIISVDALINEKNEKTLIGSKIKDTLRTSDLLSRINLSHTPPSMQSRIYPKNCRYIHNFNSGQSQLYIIEEEPQLRSMEVSMSFGPILSELKKTGKLEEYGYDKLKPKNRMRVTLSFPYIVYMVQFDRDEYRGCKVYLRLSPMTSLTDYLLIAPILNNPVGGFICSGDMVNYKSADTIHARLDNVLDGFWASNFNTDITDAYRMYKDIPELSNYLTWQYYSKVDPMFIFKVQWIKHSYSIGEELEVNHTNNSENSVGFNLRYGSLINAFVNTIPKEEIDEKTNEKQIIYENASQSLFLNHHSLSLGDEIKYQDEVHSVYSFISKKPGYGTTHMILMDSEDNKKEVRLTQDVKRDIEAQLKSERLYKELKISNGLTLKAGMLIKTVKDGHTLYNKIGKIRKGLSRRMEVQIGNDYYFASTLSDIEVLDLENYKLNNGIKLELDKEFVYLDNQNGIYPVNILHRMSFKEIIVDAGSNALYARFRTSNGNDITHSFETLENRFNFIDEKEIEKFEKVEGQINIGFKLINLDNNPHVSECYYYNNNLIINSTQTGYRAQSAIKSFILNMDHIIDPSKLLSRGKLKIPSLNGLFELKKGEEVMVFDWSNEQNNDVTRVRTVKDISEVKNKENNTSNIEVIVTDENGVDTVHTLVDGQNNIIYVGLIRKFVREVGDYKIGTKIKAKVRGIADFPMKDINEIRGFLIDNRLDEPTVICSNKATIWFNDLVNSFEVVDGTKHADKHLAENKPFRLVPGNSVIINNRNSRRNGTPCFIAEVASGPRGMAQPTRERAIIESYGGLRYNSISDIRNYFTPLGAPTPRYTKSEAADLPLIFGYPSLHGTFYENNGSDIFMRSTKKAGGK